jgi:BirA family biotin operon repressor/biotin-[acetyl-CoA-carboxylase] ligase
MALDIDSVCAALNTDRFGRRIVYKASCDSTMNVARREAEAGAEEGTVVIAEEQIAGRGRFGRSWVSPAGKNLYLTVVARPPADRLRVLSMAAPLSVCQAVSEVSDVHPVIKWPNDVLVSGRKLAGILIESEVAGADVRFSLIGVGVNVNLDVASAPDIASIATSLRTETGKEVAREAVLAAILNRFEGRYNDPLPALVETWRSLLETLGREVTVTLGSEVHRGLAENVDAAGNLVLRLPDGSRMTFEAGEVSLRQPAEA